ncbi:MAG: TonB-dependent receptor [Bacteroidales bacterium]|nr:TonB-dependent receptor [Bacteroidales bacterium]
MCLFGTDVTTLASSRPESGFESPASSVHGRILDENGSAIEYATVFVKGTQLGTLTDANGYYKLMLGNGEFVLRVDCMGYEPVEKKIHVGTNPLHPLNFTLQTAVNTLEDAVITASGISRVQRSAFNAVAVETGELRNASKNLSDALSKAPGLKLRESGGVGSDLSLMLDGFTGKHVKIFIDGVPQEGVGSSFSLNNIPVGFAERIEVYRGVVPVGFGSDAIGGVVNIVTNKTRRKWFLDASYSTGSFNTHKSNVHTGQTLKNGLMWEIHAFQNYSDNNYFVDAAIEDFETGRIDKSKKERVQRFHDTYHNEAIVGKVGVVDKKWTDRLVFGLTYSQQYKEIQNGVRQEIVYGEKFRHGHSWMPSVEYVKRNLGIQGLDLTLTGNYNRNTNTNVDTAQYKYNWYGQTKRLNSPGEQSYQHTRADNNNWNATATLNYRLGEAHTFTFNHVFNAFQRTNTSLLTKTQEQDAIDKQTQKSISGLQYRWMPSRRWNLSAFAKFYQLWVSGPMATNANQNEYVRTTRSEEALGYGLAGTYFILPGLQAKISYEKAYRLPTIEEMFGDEDLEQGDISIRPENSDNFNVNLSYHEKFGPHSLYVEGGFVWRDTKDYIQRNLVDLSGGKTAASYINYGKVKTLGGNFSARYGFGRWLSVGGNFTYMDVRDNMKIAMGTTNKPNLGYRDRMPNIPFLFADFDVNLTWADCGKKGNSLTFLYDNQYLHAFYFYSSRIGSNKDEYKIPNQFSHNISVSYSIKKGKYNFSLECRNLTNEDLYDNFSLQKAGRAFYGKVRIALGQR